jgi:hypothetical protein
MIYNSVPEFLDGLRMLSGATKAQLAPVLGTKPLTFGYRQRGTENYWLITIRTWRCHYLGCQTQRVEMTVDGKPWPATLIGIHDGLARWLQDLRKALPNFGSEGGYLIDLKLIELAEHEELPTAWSRLLGDDDQIGVDD